MYLVFAEELDGEQSAPLHTARTLEQAFSQIACRCGLSYRFEPEDEGWRLVLTDVERPECSPEPIRSAYKKPRDAQHDLMMQAVDGRLKGHVALDAEVFQQARIVKTARGTSFQVDTHG